MPLKILNKLGQNRIIGGALVLAILQFAASFAGLIRDSVLTRVFTGETRYVVDVYIAAFRPSDLLFQILIMSAFSVALVPILAGYYKNDNKEDLDKSLSSVINLGLIIFGVVAIILAIFFKNIAPLFTQFSDQKLELYIQFGRIALLTNGLFIIGNACGQHLITIQKYWIYGLTPIIYTVGTIAGTILLTPSLGAYGPIIGTLIGSLLYVTIRVIASVKAGFRPKLLIWHTDIPVIMTLMAPRMMALGVLQLQLLLFDRVASGLAEGSVTINAYARKFPAVIVGVAGIALAQSAFSLLSQAASNNEWNRYKIYLSKGIKLLLLSTIPASIILVLCTPIAAYIVNLTDDTGKTLPLFALSLLVYSFSIPFESMNHLLLRGFYALKHTITPAIFSVINGFIAIAVAWVMADSLGVYALALGFTAGQIIQMIGLSIFLYIFVKKRQST